MILLSLNNEEMEAIKTLAAPLALWQRDRFLKDVARELERHNKEIGPGLVAKIARSAQRRILDGSDKAARANARFRRRTD
jgi:hypothetical protein